MVKVYKLEELDCASCAAKLEREISKIDKVNSVSVNFLTQKLVLEADDAEFDSIEKSAKKICKKYCRVITD